ncbi:hypothetical protein [Coraliomargarita parva]|uniref:hypothetical protein n=1 Tax=Coraliomargarita parva TaxID=3014050 RepID=UPI0022B45F31|nr:hypothetical protein [Coraliomargarita parva]
MKNISRFILFVIMSFLAFGCYDQRKAESIGFNEFEDVKKFDDTFEVHVYCIDSLKGVGGGLSWVSQTILYDRYIIDLIFDVEVSRSGSLAVKKTSPLNVIVYEVDDVSTDVEGEVTMITKRELGSISEQEYDSITSAEDIFEVIGVKVVKGQPVANIRKVLKR